MSKPGVTIVIPCFNEEKNIPPLMARLASIPRCEQFCRNLKFILVDNGSTDGTSREISRFLPLIPSADMIRLEKNAGYGGGILAGLEKAETEFLGWTHADLQTDPVDILKAISIMNRKNWPENIFIKGKRTGRPFGDHFFTLAMGMFETLLLGVPLEDINAQPNIFHRSFFESWKNPPVDFSLDLFALFMARKKSLRLVRFDVLFPPRRHGQSHWNTSLLSKLRFIMRTVSYSLTLKRKFSEEGLL